MIPTPLLVFHVARAFGNAKSLVNLVHVPNFGGLSGSEDRGGGDNSIQFTNFGRVGDKNFKEWLHLRLLFCNIFVCHD